MRWCALSLLSIVSTLALVVLLGETTDESNVTIFFFLLMKVGAGIVLILCGAAWFWLSENGYLPKLPKFLTEDE